MVSKLRRAPVDTERLDIGNRRIRFPQRVGVSRNGMVATAQHRATDAGVEILEEGGNAIDAAVAAAFALGVCEPAACGLGGQTMMLIHQAESRRTIALDGSSRAPNRAVPGLLDKPERRMGYRAMTVPSTPACLRYALEQYGTLKLPRLLEPAIRLAEEGYEITPLQHWLARRELKLLKSGTAARFFLRDGERPYATGALFKQPVLAETLRRLAKKGVRDFYSGEIAAQIEQDMLRNDGLIHRDDLAQVPRPIERRPVSGHYMGYRVFTFPPPAAGRTLIQMINVFDHLPAKNRNLDTPEGAVALAEVIRRAFLDRQDRPYDPNFYLQVNSKRMLSTGHAKTVARQVLKRLRTSGETTHLSVMDRYGNAVALTQSIENVFGSCSATAELGFLYNNYMNAFDYSDISHPHYMRPNAVPWASVAPTIVFRGKRPWMAIGSPGSERITPSIFQVLHRLQTHTPFAAVDAPRLHCSLTGTVSFEAARMRDDIPAALLRHGYQLDIRDPYSFYMGCVQLVMHEGEEFIGVADPRRDGSARGPAK
ncbi:MAG: gamma-glutamyltransferase [Bryobacterales bacterium]